MPEFKLSVEYIDDEGDEVVGEVLVYAANMAEAQGKVADDLEDYFDDADPALADEASILRITEA